MTGNIETAAAIIASAIILHGCLGTIRTTVKVKLDHSPIAVQVTP